MSTDDAKADEAVECANHELPPPFDMTGYVPPDTRPLRRLRLRLMREFPEDAAQADAWFADNWDEGYPINGSWLTHFAETTALGMRARDEARVDGHLAMILRAFQRGGEYLRNLIDVNYMEDLFYEVEDEDARWGWKRVPEPLRKLYVDMWDGLISRYVERLRPQDEN